MRQLLSIVLALMAGAVTALSAPHAAAATSDWTEVKGGAVRLIASGPLEDGQYLAGLEFLLEPGWHTYWRFPGDAGIPPQFDFTGSRNIAATDVLYPAPSRYDDGFSQSIVYHDGIVLPIKVTPADADRPVSLSVSVFFGICKDICVPGDAELTLALTPSGSRDALSEKLIRRDLAAVPAPAGDTPPYIAGITERPGGDDPVLEITATLSGQAGGAPELFAEGPEGSYISLPDLKGVVGDTATWQLSTRGLAHTDGKADLILVLIDGDQTVESTHAIVLKP